jgi:hypothetical protein
MAGCPYLPGVGRCGIAGTFTRQVFYQGTASAVPLAKYETNVILSGAPRSLPAVHTASRRAVEGPRSETNCTRYEKSVRGGNRSRSGRKGLKRWSLAIAIIAECRTTSPEQSASLSSYASIAAARCSGPNLPDPVILTPSFARRRDLRLFLTLQRVRADHFPAIRFLVNCFASCFCQVSTVSPK